MAKELAAVLNICLTLLHEHLKMSKSGNQFISHERVGLRKVFNALIPTLTQPNLNFRLRCFKIFLNRVLYFSRTQKFLISSTVYIGNPERIPASHAKVRNLKVWTSPNFWHYDTCNKNNSYIPLPRIGDCMK